jgi:hypothetical protein
MTVDVIAILRDTALLGSAPAEDLSAASSGADGSRYATAPSWCSKRRRWAGSPASICRLPDRAPVGQATDETQPIHHSCPHKGKTKPGKVDPMTEQNLTTPDDDKIDDTEGHSRRRDADVTADDVEGHSRRRDADEAADDVEGHSRRRDADDTADDTEGHNWRT